MNIVANAHDSLERGARLSGIEGLSAEGAATAVNVKKARGLNIVH